MVRNKMNCVRIKVNPYCEIAGKAGQKKQLWNTQTLIVSPIRRVSLYNSKKATIYLTTNS